MGNWSERRALHWVWSFMLCSSLYRAELLGCDCVSYDTMVPCCAISSDVVKTVLMLLLSSCIDC